MHRPPHPQSPRSVGPAPVRNDSERYGSSAAVVSRGPLSGCQSSPAISVGAGPMPAGVLPTPRRAARPGWSPPKSALEKDLLIEKLVHDNEGLMREVAELDAQLRQTMDAKDDAQRTNAELLQEKQERESVSQVSERLLHSMNAQVEMVRAEREEHSRQHAADKAYLREIFTALEAQLSVVRSEREELQSRADRERRASARRIKELEDSLAVAIATKERMREECGALRQPTLQSHRPLSSAPSSALICLRVCSPYSCACADREKEILAKHFEQRVAGMRLERDQGRVDKSLLRRLEKELAELKSLSTNLLAPSRGVSTDPLGFGFNDT